MNVAFWADLVANTVVVVAALTLFLAGRAVNRSAVQVAEQAREARRLRREFERGRRRRLEELTGGKSVWCGRCGNVLEPERVAEDATFCDDCEGTSIELGGA